MSITVYVPGDSSALELGAERVAQSILQAAKARGVDIRLDRNGSRGLYWLEPLVEVVTPSGRIAYGPVKSGDIAGLFDAGFYYGRHHALCLGDIENLPYLKDQERLTFARAGKTDPLSLNDYLAHDGYRGLTNALLLESLEGKRGMARIRLSRCARRCGVLVHNSRVYE